MAPRILITGQGDLGQTTYIGPALIEAFEKYPLHTVDLASVFSDSSVRIPEESAIQAVREARRTSPSVLYFPRIDLWAANVGHAHVVAVLSMINVSYRMQFSKSSL